MVIPNRGDKRCYLLIVKDQWYLMVSLESIKEAHPRMAYRCVDQLIYPKKGERIFRTDFIQICEVYTHLPLAVFLFYHHGVGQPLRIKNLLDSPCSLKFSYLFFNSFIMIFSWVPSWLLSRSDGGVDVQVMADKIRINSRGFTSVPGKHLRSRQTLQHCLGGIQLVPAFHGEAIVPQLEKISLDHCQLSLFPNLRSLLPRLALPLIKSKLLITMRVFQQSPRVQLRVCARWPPPCIV